MARSIGELYWNITCGTKIVRQKTQDELDLEESEREVDEYLKACSTMGGE